MNPSEIKTAKEFLKIAKDLEANVTIDKETVVAISNYIDQLEKSKEYYKQSRDRYTDKVMFIAKQCDELQADNERLKADLEEAYRENEKYDNMILKASETCENCHSKYAEKIEIAKSEAVKEFAERVKESKVYDFIRHENIVPVATIDWRVKEMMVRVDDNG